MCAFLHAFPWAEKLFWCICLSPFPWTCFHLQVLYPHAEMPLDERLFRACCPYWCNMHVHDLELVKTVKCLVMTKQIPWFHRRVSVYMEIHFSFCRNRRWNAPVEMCTWKASLSQPSSLKKVQVVPFTIDCITTILSVHSVISRYKIITLKV